jgi:UDP-N-acetylglucosamine 2-epimerase (non-hydrolysing)
LGVEKGEFVLMTMHRPANVDTPEGLASILQIIEDTAHYKKVVFPIHPRTRNNIEKFGLKAKLDSIQGLILTEPQGYLEFLNLMENSSLVVTDSGGIQEETTYLQVPCLTFRDSTERPVTVELGTNQLLADLNPQTVHEKMVEILEGRTKKGIIPPLWDGNAAERIADVLVNF